MATKTISLRLDAYQRLKKARRHPHESFSEVVLRAEWPEPRRTAGDLLALYRQRGPFLSEAALEVVEQLKRDDPPPADKWGSK